MSLPMPSPADERKRKAIGVVEECSGSVTRAMRRLSPSRRIL